MATYGGGGGEPPGKRSWADILGSSLPHSWNKNILELILEKEERGAFLVNEEDVAKILGKIGISLEHHVEAVQICPNGRGVIYVTLKANISVDDFICHDVLEVNRAGVKVVNVKAAEEGMLWFS